MGHLGDLALMAQIFSECLCTETATIMLTIGQVFNSLQCFIYLPLLSGKEHLDLLLSVLSPLEYSCKFTFVNLLSVSLLCLFRFFARKSKEARRSIRTTNPRKVFDHNLAAEATAKGTCILCLMQLFIKVLLQRSGWPETIRAL